jgi:hypothetical protein
MIRAGSPRQARDRLKAGALVIGRERADTRCRQSVDAKYSRNSHATEPKRAIPGCGSPVRPCLGAVLGRLLVLVGRTSSKLLIRPKQRPTPRPSAAFFHPAVASGTAARQFAGWPGRLKQKTPKILLRLVSFGDLGLQQIVRKRYLNAITIRLGAAAGCR